MLNASATDVDLAGYALSDKESNPRKWEFPTGSIIPAGGYLVVYCSGRDEVKERNYHTNYKISQLAYYSISNSRCCQQ